MATTAAPRVRRSLRELEQPENKPLLDKVIRAFRGIQQLPPTDQNSYFVIAGYHGEPFVAEGKDIEWGGYCFHGCVLFPTWHRAYCLRLENALRSIPGCEDVTLPYWDELAEEGASNPVPQIFTSPKYTLDNVQIDNPLYSYSLQVGLKGAEGSDERYTKAKSYNTVRFPLSGLVGTPDAQEQTKVWNSKFATPEAQAEKLNWNIRNWLWGDVIIDPNAGTNNRAETNSVIGRIRRCMEAPNYTLFSNKPSARNYDKEQNKKPEDKDWVVSVEEPHNAIHLSLGGFFQKAGDNQDEEPGYNADPKDFEGANGDMGCNESAAFDPIFFIHHCWIDYLMWAWQQKHGKTKRGSLEIDHSSKVGTYMKAGNAAVKPNTTLEMTTELKPFKKPNSAGYYTSDDVTDIEELGYSYAPGSLDLHRPMLGSSEDRTFIALAETAVVKRSDYRGSFVIRTYADYNGRQVEIGRDAVLSRYTVSQCQNCEDNMEASAMVPVTRTLAELLDPQKEGKFKVTVKIQHLEGEEVWRKNGRRLGEGDHAPAAMEDQYITYA